MILLPHGSVPSCLATLGIVHNAKAMISKDAPSEEIIPKLQQVAWRCHASSHSTQAILESTFAHLRDIAQRHAKTLKFSPYVSWLYSSCSDYIKQSGMSQVLPSGEDFIENFGRKRSFDSKEMQAFNQAFHPDKTKLPECDHVDFPKNAKGLTSCKWRSAGPLSHYRASATMFFLVKDMPHNWTNCLKAWCGCVLHRGGIFVHGTDNRYWLSLGFTSPAALMISLEVGTSSITLGQDSPSGDFKVSTRNRTAELNHQNIWGKREVRK